MFPAACCASGCSKHQRSFAFSAEAPALAPAPMTAPSGAPGWAAGLTPGPAPGGLLIASDRVVQWSCSLCDAHVEHKT